MITGYRIWIVSNKGMLKPTCWGGSLPAWQLEGNKARCLNKCHHPPTKSKYVRIDHSCGFHAYNSIAELVRGTLENRYGGFHCYHNRGFIRVFGTVTMWGKTIHHEWGYRSKYAKIESIIYVKDDIPLELLDKIKANYPVPFHEIESTDELRRRAGDESWRTKRSHD